MHGIYEGIQCQRMIDDVIRGPNLEEKDTCRPLIKK